MSVAYAFASGEIEFARSCPDGALVIARGPEKRLRALIEPAARHAYDDTTLLVPGIPEAASADLALDALLAFITRLDAKRSIGGGE